MGYRSRIRFVTSTVLTYSARSVHGCGPTRAVVVVGEEWAEVVRSSPDRKVVVGAEPVGSHHGSYQLVSWWGGHCLCPSMAHARWWQATYAIRDIVCRGVRVNFARNGFLSCHEIRGVRTSRIAALHVTTLYGPWEGTNNGHPTMILTGMTHGDYQPALHPPPSDLGKISPLLPTLPQPPPPP